MEKEQLVKHLEALPLAYARHEVIMDGEGKPVDFSILAVNAAYESMTGLKRPEIIGKRITTILPSILNAELDWIGILGRVATTGQSISFEQYAEPLGRWYDITAYKDGEKHFSTIFMEISARKHQLVTMQSLLELTDELLHVNGEGFDFEKPAQALLRLSAANGVILTLYGKEGMEVKAWAGAPRILHHLASPPGTIIEKHSPLAFLEDSQASSRGRLTSLLQGDLTPGGDFWQKLSREGQVQRIALRSGNSGLLGEALFILDKNDLFHNPEAVELYCAQLSAVLCRLRSDYELHVKEQAMEASINAIALVDLEGFITYVNPALLKMWAFERIDQVLGRKFTDLWEESDKTAHLIDGLVQGGCFNGGLSAYRLNGEAMDVHLSATMVYDSNEVPLKMIASCIDITERRHIEEALKKANDNMNSVLQNTLFGVLIIDMKRTIRWVNPAVHRLLGLSDDSTLIGEHCGEHLCFHKDDPCPILDLGGELEHSERIIRRQDGQTIPIIKTVKKVIIDGEEMLLETFIDISEQKNAEKALKARLKMERLLAVISSRFLNLLADEIEEGIHFAIQSMAVSFKADRGCLFRVNAAGTKASARYPWFKEETKAQHPFAQELCLEDMAWLAKKLHSGEAVQIPGGQSLPEQAGAVQGWLEREALKSAIFVPLLKDNKLHSFFFFANLNLNGDWSEDQVVTLKVVAEMLVNLLIRRDKDETIRRLSLRDQLTGLYNRHYFAEELKRLEHSGEYPIAIISADLDGLKLINDTMGHSEGDRYLQTGAALLQGCLRESDLLCRVGGDEFVLLLPCTGREKAGIILDRIYKEVEANNSPGGGLPLSLSLGLAVSEDSRRSLEETYRDADELMYKDKLKRGKTARSDIIKHMLAELYNRYDAHCVENEQLQYLCAMLGHKFGLEENQMARLMLLAQVRDLGMITVPSSVLQKEQPLDSSERESIGRHAERGYRIAQASEDLSEIAELVLHHHERYDGTGYPLGLSGEEIPLECRVLAVAETYSALTVDRPHRPALTEPEALAEIEALAGSHLDPDLCTTFLQLKKEENAGEG